MSQERKSGTLAQLGVPLMFLPQFDVFCDLLLNRPTTTQNLFILYDTKGKYC